jgi:hypothetical protein
MAMVPLNIRPGVNVQATYLSNEGGYSASNLVRFKDGLLQKLGGSIRLTNTAVIGTARGMKAWADLAGNQYIGIGTNKRLHLYLQEQLYDITPQLQIDNLTAPFSTQAGSRTVTVTDGGYTPIVGDYIIIANMSYVGGLVLQGSYEVKTVGSGNYTITASVPATTTVVSGGATLSFQTTVSSTTVIITLATYPFTNYQNILVGVPTSVGGLTIGGAYDVTVTNQGYGDGYFGQNYYGNTPGSATITTASAAGSSAGPTYENGGNVRIIYGLHSSVDNTNFGYGDGAYSVGPYGLSISGYNTLRQWSLDNWGQLLVASYTGGPPYVWTPPLGTVYSNSAALIPRAVYTGNYVPWTSTGLFVAMPQQQLVIYGTDMTLVSTPGAATQDPLLIRFSDVSDYSSWLVTATNQAGSFRLPSGSRIVGGIQAPLQGLFWTDIEFWSMQYIGYPLVYSFTKLGIGCGLISLRGVAKMGPEIYWMSQKGFFVYNGSAVEPVRCTVWDFVFNNIDTNYLDNVFAAPNAYFNEIGFYFPTVGSNGVVTSYAKLNVLDKVWDCGTLTRTDWIDQSILGAPIGVDQNGILQQHEMDNDFDGQAMDSYAWTGWFKLGEGDNFLSIQRILPDFVISGGSVKLTVQTADYVNDDTTSTPSKLKTFGPFVVTSTTEYVIVKGRGRVGRIKIESTDHSVFWRAGKNEMVIGPAGRR